mgnify:FL=1
MLFRSHLNEQGATDRSNMLWKEACKSFENSLAISGGDNIEALLAFAQRLLEHAQSISSSNSIEKTDDLLLALSLVDDAIDLLRDYPAPDPEWEPYLNEQKSTALDMLNREASDEFIAKLKEGEKPEIGYICEARIKLNKHANELDGGIPAAIDILEQAEAKHIRLSARTLLFKVSLIKDERSGKNHNFKTIAELYDKLSHDPDYKMRIIDIFRHAVSLYQTGQYERGQKRFKELRGYLSREGLTPPKVRDRLLENDKPFRPKSFTIKVVRVVSNWKAEGFIEEINQTIPLRPRHYAPPPIEREIRKCAIRFEIFGPLAVPLRFEPI